MACAGAAVAPAWRAAPEAASLTFAQSGEPIERRAIEIVARRFAFEPAVVEVLVDEPVRLVVRSADGVHGIRIARLGINREIPRGDKPVTIEFQAAEAGEYPIVCSEYCGSGHEDMKGMLVVRARTEAEE